MNLRLTCLAAITGGQAALCLVDLAAGQYRRAAIAGLCAVVNLLIYW